jgi:hypothetical protein
LIFSACVPKRPEPKKKLEAEGNMPQANPHAQESTGGGLDIDGLLASLPEGWKKETPSSNMRLGQASLALSPGDTGKAELAIFHFPGTGGSATANIARWQAQFTGPKGEPGADVAKTDSMKVGPLKVVTTAISGTQLAGNAAMGTGPAVDLPNSRMLASVIETPGGNFFLKLTGPEKTISAHEARYRALLQKAKTKG